MAAVPSHALILARISDARDDDTHGVDGQVRDCTRHGTQLGWKFGPAGTHVVIENDTSAFKRRKIELPDGRHELRTVRPGFRRALSMLASGAADGLMALDLDRACRDPRDLEDLIDVVESSYPRIPVASVTGSLRLESDADISMARVMVAIANKASRDTARRVAAARERGAREGKFGGGVRPYGFEPDGVTVREAEAAEIRNAADALLHGVSMRQVLLDLRSRNVPTVKGSPWSSLTVRDILLRPRTAGLMVHKGKIAGPAPWEPILARPVWEAVRLILSDPARRQSPGNTPRWLGSKLYRCGVCNDGTVCHVHGIAQRGGGQYRCESGPHLACSARAADDFVSAVIVARMARPDAAELITPPPPAAPDLSELRRRAAALRKLKDEQAVLHARGFIDAEQLAAGTAELNTQLAAVEVHLAVPLPLDPLDAIAGNPRAGEVWNAFDLGRKRAVLAALMTVTIMPGAPSGPRFQTERVRIKWRETH